MGSGPFGLPRTLKEYIGELFDEHGPVAIMEALARRLKDEAGIAHGEGRDEEAAMWDHMATDLDDLAVDFAERLEEDEE